MFTIHYLMLLIITSRVKSCIIKIKESICLIDVSQGSRSCNVLLKQLAWAKSIQITEVSLIISSNLPLQVFENEN